ncbi:MAG: patatin-like phospholipase family protein, partial [Eubacteriales bacterium]
MPARTKKKLALVFTGAVSLGSFEAGVAYEIVKYIHEQNNPELEIDVIVGTSAGALTGALTALALVFGTDPQYIEEAWLSVRLDDLLRLNPGDKSLLSSSKVQGLITKYIGPPSAGKVLYPVKDSVVNLVVVVTNLDGIKYEIHRAKEDEFAVSAIGYEDALKFQIEPGFRDWDRLRSAVRASSAYPAAFEHKTILRVSDEFRRVAKYNFRDNEGRDFNFADGGIVNNQPLNRAIEIVNELPVKNAKDGWERIFLVVDPSPPVGDIAHRGNYGVFDVVSKAVWTIPRNQTLYQDLLLLEKVNRRLNWKNSFVSAMADIWDSARFPAGKVHALNELCREVALFKGKTILGIDPAGYLEAEEKRIRNAYSSEIEKVNNVDFFVKYCFLLEQVADLRNKQEITVEMIKPQNPQRELAGVIFGNFGGFLDSGFMKHDFNVGRTYASRWLKKELDLSREIHFRQSEMPAAIRRKVFQMLFDNSIPLVIEDIGPRLFSGKESLPREVTGLFSFIRMGALSIMRYLAGKTVSWTREKILSK